MVFSEILLPVTCSCEGGLLLAIASLLVLISWCEHVMCSLSLLVCLHFNCESFVVALFIEFTDFSFVDFRFIYKVNSDY